jgi:hypothetical protein
MKPILATLLAVALWLFADVAAPARYDAAAADVPILRDLEPLLDREGIDVRGGGASLTAFTAPRPHLAPLASLPVIDLAIERVPDRFGQLFEAGVFSDAALVATRTRTARPNISETEFRERWASSSQSERVFVSFSGSDVDLAERVRTALEAKGYVAFLYKDNSSKYPKTNSVQVGNYFREAGHHLVVVQQMPEAALGSLRKLLHFAP